MITMFGMNGETKVKTHTFRTKLTPSVDKPTVDLTLYRYMIGTLLYLTSSRPDIMFFLLLCEIPSKSTRTAYYGNEEYFFRYLHRTTFFRCDICLIQVSLYPSNTRTS